MTTYNVQAVARQSGRQASEKVKKAFLKKQNNEKHHAARDAEMRTDVNLQEDYSKSKSVTEVFTADPGECGQGCKL